MPRVAINELQTANSLIYLPEKSLKKGNIFFILVTTPPKMVLTDNQQTLYGVSFPPKKKTFLDDILYPMHKATFRKQFLV